jgi:hypothetical protein
MFEVLNKLKKETNSLQAKIDEINEDITNNCEELFNESEEREKIDPASTFFRSVLENVSEVVKAYEENKDYYDLLQTLPKYIIPYLEAKIPYLDLDKPEIQTVSDQEALAMRAPFSTLLEQYQENILEVGKALDQVRNSLKEDFNLNDLFGMLGQVRRSFDNKKSAEAKFLQDFLDLLYTNSKIMKELNTTQLKEFLYSF